MDTEKERSFLIHILYIGCVLGLFYLFFHYIMYEVLPFLLGFLIAFSLRPAVRHTIRLCHLPQKFVSLCYLVLFYGTIGTAITLLSIRCFQFLSSFVTQLPMLYETQISTMLSSMLSQLEQMLSHLSPTAYYDVEQFFLQASASLDALAKELSSGMFSFVTSIASSLPSILISFFITILSSIFFALDFPRVSKFIMRQIPKKRHIHLYRLRTIVTDTVLNYVGAYGKLMLITCVELSVGLSVLQVDHAIPIALMISCFDILPVLGTGTILFPWMLISVFHQQMKLAVGLLILHLIINLIRQIIEPKIVGKQLGIHPLLMLGCMFFGVKLLGFLGIFIAPIIVQVVCQLNKEGLLHLYR